MGIEPQLLGRDTGGGKDEKTSRKRKGGKDAKYYGREGMSHSFGTGEIVG